MRYSAGIRRPGRRGRGAVLAIALGALVWGAASQARPPVAGARYVAMGSSFAAGPGVTTSADAPPNRCTRSIDNYAHQLARKRKLSLVDVSCGGATTANVLQPWEELPAQIDALTPDTALVTVTIGGNDVAFIGRLIMDSCSGSPAGAATPTMCQAMAAHRTAGAEPASLPRLSAPTEERWRSVEAGLDRIALEVRRRSPKARLVFVDYLSVVPAGRPCGELPLSAEAAAAARATAARLAQLTAAAAGRAKADLIRASALSRGHDACSSDPWVSGFSPPAGVTGFVPYHPNLRGMSAIAHALEEQLGR